MGVVDVWWCILGVFGYCFARRNGWSLGLTASDVLRDYDCRWIDRCREGVGYDVCIVCLGISM